ncbi:17.3 kDa class II heat shock protein-like [Vigna umbellata]|uniref:17.3 kDa class II heat shock protein-like n=1 Tax=Vigna umbellata TaxID=87088 RepID=UPI001F5F8404|nr:17.3 kDa class II heat shock protein-like [Vigna umbellata]
MGIKYGIVWNSLVLFCKSFWTYVGDVRVMVATYADVKEYPNRYVFVIDMPGVKAGDIEVQVKEDNVLIISGYKKREEEREGVEYLITERRVGKFMRRFTLPDDANSDAISVMDQNGVLTVTIKKLPPLDVKFD